MDKVEKGAPLFPDKEHLIFSREGHGSGVINLLWLTMESDDPLTVNYYIDGEQTPSISMDMLLGMTGTGFGAASFDIPWGTSNRGKLASSGGVYSFRKVPFSQSIKITVVYASNDANQTEKRSKLVPIDLDDQKIPPQLFSIVRGLDNYRIQVGGILLPQNARLMLYKSTADLNLLSYLTLAKVTNATGLLSEITFQAQSSQYIYLEGCYRAFIDGATSPMFLSSGTEDNNLSANYYDGGPFETQWSGCTVMNEALHRISAYRLYHDDPIVFHSSIQLEWRNSEDLACPVEYQVSLKNPASKKLPDSPLNVQVLMYTWIYQW